jgi:hypothetical protein
MGDVGEKTDRNAKALGFLRIAVGALFVIFGEYKVFGREFALAGGFQFWINRFLAEGAYPFMTPILRGFVLPHGAALRFWLRMENWRLGWRLC